MQDSVDFHNCLFQSNIYPIAQICNPCPQPQTTQNKKNHNPDSADLKSGPQQQQKKPQFFRTCGFFEAKRLDG